MTTDSKVCSICGTARKRIAVKLSEITAELVRRHGLPSLSETPQVCVSCGRCCRQIVCHASHVRIEISPVTQRSFSQFKRYRPRTFRVKHDGTFLRYLSPQGKRVSENVMISSPKCDDSLRVAAAAVTSILNEPSLCLPLPPNAQLAPRSVRRKIDFATSLETTSTGHIVNSRPIRDSLLALNRSSCTQSILIGKRGRGHMVADGVYQVTDPSQGEPRDEVEIIRDNALPSWTLVSTKSLLSLLHNSSCYACGARALSLIDRGSGMIGRVATVGLKCTRCNEEFRFQRNPHSVLDPTDMRSPFIQNVLYAVAMLFRGNGLTRLNTASALTGTGMGVSHPSAYRYIQHSGLSQKIIRACKLDCEHALNEIIRLHSIKRAKARGSGGLMRCDIEGFYLPLSYDGAWSHGRNASVGWGDLLAHEFDVPGYVTRYPVVAFHAVQKNRESGRKPCGAEDDAQYSTEFDSYGLENESVTRVLEFLGEHGDLASQTMEHYCFDKCMQGVEQRLVENAVNARLVIDGDVGLGARALVYSFISEIGLDMRHFASTFKKRLLASYSSNGRPMRSLEELITRIQLHFRWCYFTGLETDWTEAVFDNNVIQCVSHWCDNHVECAEQSICKRSGRGNSYRVSPKVSLRNMPNSNIEVLRENIRGALKREKWQKVLVHEKSGVNESLHIHLLFQGASNGKFGNDSHNALLRRHLEIMTWNRGVEWTYRVVLRFLFGSRKVLSQNDWQEIRQLDMEIHRLRVLQQRTIQQEKEERRKCADEFLHQLRPVDMSFDTKLIPYGVLVDKCNEIIGNTPLNTLFSSVLLSGKAREVYRARPKCRGCKIQLPDLEGLCNSCRARQMLFRSGWKHATTARVIARL